MTIKKLFETAPVTLVLLISFIGLFILQILTGVDANNPDSDALIHWGANFLPMTMLDEPWRLLSSGFLHIGLMHLLFNGFAMYFFGQVAEPMFGSVKFLLLFLLAVAGGNLLNSQMTWLGILDGVGPGLSAGASGGIMGIGAALLIASLFKMSVNGMVLNLKSLILIMGINLVYGFAVPGIDNAGHIGGALTGLLFALPIAIVYRQRLSAQHAAIQASQQARLDSYSNAHNSTTYDSGTDNNHLPLTNIFADNSHIPVNSDNSIATDATIDDGSLNNAHNDDNLYDNRDISADTEINNASRIVPEDSMSTDFANNFAIKAVRAESGHQTLIWKLIPWLTMLLIIIGFFFWWQDMHNQLLQAIAATE